MHNSERGNILLAIAQHAIAAEFDGARFIAADAPWLHEHAASFITLTRDDALRGCIGTLEPHRSLHDDVRANAKAAAFFDPRFEPLSIDEFDSIAIEVSVLSPTQPLSFASEADALQQLRPNIDGVVFEYQHYRSTFLPQVWEQLPTAEIFLENLKRKARLPGNFWSPDIRLRRYTVTKYKDSETLTSATRTTRSLQ